MIRVLYIAGAGRSGSTILGDILGQIDGWFHGGEIRSLWDRGLIDDQKCGCDRFFGDCPFWANVLSDAFGDPGIPDPRQMVYFRESLSRSHHLLFYRKDRIRNIFENDKAPYMNALNKLYHSVDSVAKTRVIVDSSKFPGYAYLLSLLPEIELFVLHLVRDPRAVAYSWWVRRKRDLESKKVGYMRRFNPVRSTLAWNVWNHLIRSLWGSRSSSYLLLRYEDFVSDPKTCVEEILSMMGEENVRLPFRDDGYVMLTPGHSVGGNPGRFTTGAVRISEDQEWKERMPYWQKSVVTGLALPGLKKYGYQVVV